MSDLPPPEAAAVTDGVRSRRQGSLMRWFFGPPELVRLTVTHCVHGAAEVFFTVSMAGSIFFSVSPDAARPRVLLYLVLTLAPFVVMAPLVGPLVDRVRSGLATIMVGSFVVRAVLAVLLAENLRGVALFPLAFGLLVVAKLYTVARNAMVPSMVGDLRDLVAANARLSRSATIVGAFSAAAAVGLFAATSGVWTIRVGAVIYLVGAAAAWRVRSVARPIDRVEPDVFVRLVQPDVSSAIWDMMVLRAAIGFALFQFGFSLRAEGQPAWMLGAVILANGLGGFLGTIISPWMRRHMTERSMFTAALLGPAVATAICGFAFNEVTLVFTIGVLGLAVSVGRRALDATIQTHAPDARRGQVYAILETRLELAWVAAACLAVALRVASWVGVLALAGFLATVAIAHLRRHTGLHVLWPAAAAPLADRLVMRAETLAEHGYYDEAIVVARSVGRVVAGGAGEGGELHQLTAHDDPSVVHAAIDDLEREAAEAITAARRIAGTI